MSERQTDRQTDRQTEAEGERHRDGEYAYPVFAYPESNARQQSVSAPIA